MTGAARTPRPKGRLVVLSGPSGVGKSAIAARLLRDPRFDRAITATTREKRPGERDGVDYVFLTAEEFQRRLGRDGFLEHAMVYGNRYGTPRESVERVLGSGKHCLLVVDIQGATTLFGMHLDAEFVFLQPPDAAELIRRLKERGGDSPDSVRRRLAMAEQEMREGKAWPHQVVNRDVEQAAREIATLVGVTLA